MARTAYEREIRNEAIWSFETERFFVGYYAEPDDTDPTKCFQFDEDAEAARNGEVEWFCARVCVYLKGEGAYDWTEIGCDYLGACAYKNVSDFCTGENRNGYFRDMVRNALGEAREELARLGRVSHTIHE
jgi:hypothetical protein